MREEAAVGGPGGEEGLERGRGRREPRVRGARREERVELADDQAAVDVDVAADGEEGDAAVGDAEGGEGGAREDGGLDLWACELCVWTSLRGDGVAGRLGEGEGEGRGTYAFRVGDPPQVQIPDYAARVRREAVVVQDDVSGRHGAVSAAFTREYILRAGSASAFCGIGMNSQTRDQRS